MKRFLYLTFSVMILASCVPSANMLDGDDSCGLGEEYNVVTRQCELQSNQAPTPTLNSQQIYEDSGTNTIVLTYYDVDNEPATYCQILTYDSGIDDTPPNPCSCTDGVCSVPLTPDDNYYGTTYFTYRLIDSDGYSSAQTVTVVVNSVNDQPEAASIDPYTVDENSVLYGTVSGATDNDSSDTLYYTLLSTPVHGTMNLSSGGSFSYYPLDDSTDHGQDIETIYYRVCDNGSPSLCDTGTLNIGIDAVNDAPVSNSSLVKVTTNEDTAVVVTADIATDAEGDTMLYLLYTSPSHGVVSDCFDTDGSTSGTRTCTYTPDTNYDSTDYFTYRVCDDYDGDKSADDCSSVVTVVVTMTPVNDAPVAIDSTITISEDGTAQNSLAASDVDDDEDDLTYQVVDNPSYGSVTFSDDEYTYTPNENVNSESIWIDEGNAAPGSQPDSFTYKVCDDDGECSGTQTVTINITAIADDPVITLPSPYTGITLPTISMNEGGTFNLLGLTVDEGGASDEDSDELQIEVTVADYSSVPYTQILPVDLSDNSHVNLKYDSTTIGAAGNYPLNGNFVSVGDGTNSGDASSLNMFLTPVAGESGTVQITVTVKEVSTGTEVEQSFLFTVNSVTALHGGWKHIKAIGVKKDRAGNVVSYARDSDGEIITDTYGNPTYRNTPQVELEWNAMTIAGTSNPDVSISGWQIFRRLSDEDYNWDEPLAVIASESTREYIDTDFSDSVFWDGSNFKSTVLYYTVRPVDSDEGLPVPTQEVFSEIRVIAPPDNMVFVHRWMVNQEICEKMHYSLGTSTIDAAHNFRCAFTGPGDDSGSGYYDIGQDLLVDIAEAGCPYNQIGKGDPNSNGLTGSSGNVYYDRSSGDCYIYDDTDGTDWDKISADTSDIIEDSLTSTIADNSSAVFLPPLVNVTAGNAATICQARNEATIYGLSGDQTSSQPFLPSRKQQIAYSSWDSGLGDSTAAEYEEGENLDDASKCNSSNADGVDSGYSSAETPGGSYLYSLPGTDSSGIRSIYTGAEELGLLALTPSCVSRYGAQDVYGNVSEWVSDRLECGATQYECTGIDRVGDANPNLNDWEGYAMDNNSGVCADSSGSCDDYMTSWYLKDMTYYSRKFSLPLGLPYYGSYAGSDTLMVLGSSSLGLTSSQLRGDYVSIDTEILEAESTFGGYVNIATGGGYESGDKSGRYSLEFIPASYVPAVGSRGDYAASTYTAGNDNDGLNFTAVGSGAAGNSISVSIEDDGTVDACSSSDSPIVTVDSNAITVNVDSTLFCGTSVEEVIDAINDPYSGSSALVTAAWDDTDNGNAAASLTFQNVTLTAATFANKADGNRITLTLIDDDVAAGNGDEVVTIVGHRIEVEIDVDDDDGDGQVTSSESLCTVLMSSASSYISDCTHTDDYIVHDGVRYTANPGQNFALEVVADAASGTVSYEDNGTFITIHVATDITSDFVVSSDWSAIEDKITLSLDSTVTQTGGLRRYYIHEGVQYTAAVSTDVNLQISDTGGGGGETYSEAAPPLAAVGAEFTLSDSDAVETALVGATILSAVASPGGVIQTATYGPTSLSSDNGYTTYLTGGTAIAELSETNFNSGKGSLTISPNGTLTLTGGVDYQSSKRSDIGFRCVIPVQSSEYTDSVHSYGY